MLGVLYRDRQLQHRSGLASDQLRELQNLPIWEFQRVVLNVRIIHIDLPEACHLVANTGLAKQAERTVVPDVVIERQFRSGQQANRDLGWTVMNDELGTVLPDGGKATRARKFRSNKLVANLGGARGDVV
jgi:hypothetical protein